MTSTPSPQDPYRSFLVAASAGSGKTYQLSRRFLHLIGAGAKPQSILTVTFTKKAAGEMRQRILAEAARLTVDKAAQTLFQAELDAFHRDAARRGMPVPPPRPAATVGHVVLAASQTLSISTIDSLFLEWMRKFPDEASAEPGEHAEPPVPSPFKLVDPVRQREITDLAWTATCRFLARSLGKDDETTRSILQALPDQDLHAAAGRLRSLSRLGTFLWYAEAERAEAGGNHAFLALPEPADAALVVGMTDSDLITELTPALLAVAAALANEDRRALWHDGIHRRDFQSLVHSGLFTKAFGVSGQYIRGKKRDALQVEIDGIERQVRAFVNVQRVATLQRQGEAQYELHRLYRRLRAELMARRNLVDFDDLAKGSFRLFRNDAGLGVRYLMARTTRHVLLDEFQDTSRLQWAIFAEMTASMLAGDGIEDPSEGPPSSVFIVGDAKQSIYGFREADPTVMTTAERLLEGRLDPCPLNDSYRTAQVVLDYVNEVFKDSHLPNFPRHETATISGTAVVDDVGRVMVAPLVEGADELTAAEAEATLLAETLARAFSGALPCPVRERGQSESRALKPGDCVILYRSATHAALYEGALRRLGIPCQREEARGFFARAEVRDAMALVRYLALPADVVSLATVLRSPFCGLGDDDVLKLFKDTTASTKDSARAGRMLEQLRLTEPELANVLTDLASRSGLELPHALLAKALAWFDAFGAYSRPELYSELKKEIAALTEAPMARQNLTRLLELVLKLEDDGLTTLPSVLRRLESLAEDDEVGSGQLGHDAVTLMTIHKAKGLEYPLVAVVDTGRAWGKRDLYWTQGVDDDGRAGLHYIGTSETQPVADPAFQALTSQASDAITEECHRLLYVALTRARQYLLVTGHKPGRRSGLDDSFLHERMAQALMTKESAIRTIDVGGTLIGAWEAGSLQAPKMSLEAAVSERATPHLQLTPAAGYPRELRLVSPSRHEVLGARADAGLKLLSWGDGPTATAVGIFLHSGMEACLLDRSFDAETAWRRVTTMRAIGEETHQQAMAILNSAQSDPYWARLKTNALRLESELDLVHQVDAHTLVRGSLDLLVELPGQRLLILDFKATRFAGDHELLTDIALADFAEERGYGQQLRAYGTAIALIYPGWTIDLGIYFLSLRRVVTLSR